MTRGEEKAVRRLVKFLRARGFLIADADKIISKVDETGQAQFTVRAPEGRHAHQILAIAGNAENGEELFADYSYATGDPDGFNHAMEKFSDADYHFYGKYPNG